MKELVAFEYNGKIYRTKEEAFDQELYDGLLNILTRNDRYEIARSIVRSKKVQAELISLLTKYQKEVQE